MNRSAPCTTFAVSRHARSITTMMRFCVSRSVAVLGSLGGRGWNSAMVKQADGYFQKASTLDFSQQINAVLFYSTPRVNRPCGRILVTR